MVKKILLCISFLLVIVGTILFFKVTKIDKKRVSDIEYKILLEEEIPEEIFEEIETYKDKNMQCSYICSDKLYIVVCYGMQNVSGYTVEVNDLYESSNAIFVKTTLKGPASLKDAKEECSYPYVVIKLPISEKKVVFI